MSFLRVQLIKPHSNNPGHLHAALHASVMGVSRQLVSHHELEAVPTRLSHSQGGGGGADGKGSAFSLRFSALLRLRSLRTRSAATLASYPGHLQAE